MRKFIALTSALLLLSSSAFGDDKTVQSNQSKISTSYRENLQPGSKVLANNVNAQFMSTATNNTVSKEQKAPRHKWIGIDFSAGVPSGG